MLDWEATRRLKEAAAGLRIVHSESRPGTDKVGGRARGKTPLRAIERRRSVPVPCLKCGASRSCPFSHALWFRRIRAARIYGRHTTLVRQRIRPKFMTVATTFIGLVPIMWSIGTGSDVMKRIAAPMVGGIFTSFLLELLVYPAIYEIWKWHFEVKKQLS